MDGSGAGSRAGHAVEGRHHLVARFTQFIVGDGKRRRKTHHIVACADRKQMLFAESGGVDGKGCPCRFIAVERSNTVVIRAPGPNIRAAKKLARRLDRSDAEVEIARLKAMDA